MDSAFRGASKMRYRATDAPDLSNVMSMKRMFSGAVVFNGNLNSWDVSNVKNMLSMFLNAGAFNGDISSWNVSKVTGMGAMFANARTFNQDISGWKVSEVKDMSNMFSDASKFNQDISGWKVSKVTDMSGMFSFATDFNQDIGDWKVSSVTKMYGMFVSAGTFNQDISGWNVSKVTGMAAMFSSAIAFNQDISDWKVSNVTDMSNMFSNANKFNQDISSWDVSKVTNMRDMFVRANDFEQNLGKWYITLDELRVNKLVPAGSNLGEITAQNDVLNRQNPIYTITGPDADDFTITDNALIINSVPSFSIKPLYDITITSTGNFGTDNSVRLEIEVDNPSDSFITTWEVPNNSREIVFNGVGTYTINWGDDTELQSVIGSTSHTYATANTYTVIASNGITAFTTYLSVNDAENAKKLRFIDQWGNAQWTTMYSAFRGASKMRYRATDTPDLSNVTDMSQMFNGANVFNGNISGWNVSNVENMYSMFTFASAFNSNISSWKVSKVTNMSRMFAYASIFNQDLNDWDVREVTNMSAMFVSTNRFNGNISDWKVSKVTNMENMFVHASRFNQDLNGWDVRKVTDMRNMFHNADDFEQNLGKWYITPDIFTVNEFVPAGSRVGEITAQNTPLNAQSPVYAITSDDDGDAFTLNGNILTINSSPLSFVKSLYEITITSTGSFGTGNRRQLVINIADTSPPDAPVINTEAISTNQNSITISGTAQLGSEVTLSRDEDTFISVTTVDSNGGWSIENIVLIENANTFTATATDVGGTSGNSNSVIIRLDTSSPDAPVINTEATTTNQHRITISGTAQLGSEVTLSRDEDTFISVTTVEGNGDWSIENISLIENANTFTATATDVGGTSGNSNSVIIRLDTSSPDAPVINTEATTTNQHSITISGTAQSGSEVTLSRDEDTFISVTTVDSNGGWSIENIVLIENANTFTATATDVGGTSGNSNSVIIRLDTTVPIPPVINTEATTTNQNSITISGTAQLGSEVTLSRDEDTFISVTTVDSNGGWSIENIVLIENANTFTATATDVGGISGNSNSVIIRLDTSSPDAPVINTEAISTNQHRITISGTAQLGSEVTLSRDEDTFISVTTVEGNGDWSIENISLIENANTFTATATDVGGTSGNSNSVIIRLDTSSPDAPVINTEATTTNQHRITISGTAQLGSEVTLSRDEDTFISVTTVEGNGDWSIENISLIENANTFTATATDVGGTSGNSNSVIIRLDTTVPIPPVINTEAITTNQHSITISGTAQLGSEVTLSRDEDTFISVTTVNSNGGWSIENIVLIENANTFTATATDVGGTSGNSNSVIIRLDTSSPDAPVINTEATTTNQHSITISGTAQSGSEVTLSRDEDTFISVTTVDSNGGWSIENIVLIENANTFTATATDVGGTSGNSNSVIIRLDTTVPIPPVINTEATTTNQNSITISGTAQLGSEVTLSRDEDTFISVTTVDSNGGWSIENIVLIENANTFTATATDVGGISGNSNSVIIRLDTSSPDAPVINTEATTTNQNSITISGTAQLGSEVTLSRDEDTFISVTTVDSNGGWSIENIVLIENANTFTATATDVGGISGNSNSVIIRLDTSSPDAPVINTEATTYKSTQYNDFRYSTIGF